MSTQPVPSRPLSSSGPSRQIKSHTGLRGIAALMVVTYHHQLGSFHRLWIENHTQLFHRSYLMVDLFFVLSGFIISYVYIADRRERWSAAETKSFWFARFARVYPLHVFSLLYLTLFVVGIWCLFTLVGRYHPGLTTNDLIDWVLELFLVHSWVPGHVGWNIPSWSISSEIFAYFVFPAIVALHYLNRRAAIALLLCLSITFYAYCWLSTGNLDIIAGLAPFRCLAGFSVGVLIYYNRSVVTKLPSGLLGFAQVLGAISVLAVLSARVSDPLIIPPVAILVWSTWTDRGPVSRVLSARPMQWLGDVSYSVYLLHVPLITSLLLPWSWLQPRLGISPDLGRAIWLSLTFFVILGISTLSYKFIEVPARRNLVQWSRGRVSRRLDALIPAP